MASFEPTPGSELTSHHSARSPSEVTTIIVHYYRGEMARMSSWRARLDQTSNWAITVTAAMLSVSLSTPTSHHGVLLFAMVLVLLLLFIEARRYRFFDVYRDRVRLVEKHYLGAFFGSEPLPRPWQDVLSQSLKHPQFNITAFGAMCRRLRRNYIWMFLILLLAWLLKISSSLLQPAGAATADAHAPYVDVIASAQLGPIPGWAVMAGVAAFYAFLGWMSRQRITRDEDDGSVHV